MDMRPCVCLCIHLHAVSFRPAGPCNKIGLEENVSQNTKLLTAQAGDTKLFPKPVTQLQESWGYFRLLTEACRSKLFSVMVVV